MINYAQAFDNSRMAIARLRSLEQFTEDDAINIFKKALGCNGKQAKKAWKKLKDKKKGGVIDLGNGLFRLRNENEIDLENNKGLTEVVGIAAEATRVIEESERKAEVARDRLAELGETVEEPEESEESEESEKSSD